MFADSIGLVFMDIGLPGMDGFRAALQIREMELREGRKRVPIVALTGHADAHQCLAVGMDDFLQKPAMLADIRKMLDKFLPETKQPVFTKLLILRCLMQCSTEKSVCRKRRAIPDE